MQGGAEMKKEITYSCGHTGVVEVFGGVKAQEKKIRWYETEGLCPECYKKHLGEELATFEQEHKLPDLEGTERQVKWARDIRREVISTFDGNEKKTIRPAMGDAFADYFDAFELEYCGKLTSAKWWIENRDEYDSFKRSLFQAAMDAYKK